MPISSVSYDDQGNRAGSFRGRLRVGGHAWLRWPGSAGACALLVAALVLLGASIAVYFMLSASLRQPFYVGVRHLRYFDLRVYRGAAWRVVHGRPLYRRAIVRHLGFTYPPIAAVLLWPLALFPLKSDELGITAISLVALVWLLRRTLEIARHSLPRVGRALSHPVRAWVVALLAAAAAVWLEPVTVTLGYGQIDLVIAALVVFDISRPDTARSKGAAIGLAAGIKLTPLLFIPYLLLSGRRRAALVSGLTFLGTIAASFVLTPGDASRYWGGLVLRTSRIGKAPDIDNQSLRGALARWAGTWHPGDWVSLVVLVIAVIGLALAVRASRRGNEPAGFSLCAITALLCSPVSWSHHWVLAVPGLLLLFLVGYERRSAWMLLATLALLVVGYGYIPERTMRKHPPVLGGAHTLVSDPYVLVGVLVLAAAGLLAMAPSLRVARRARALA